MTSSSNKTSDESDETEYKPNFKEKVAAKQKEDVAPSLDEDDEETLDFFKRLATDD
jgi:hypothetical protein